MSSCRSMLIITISIGLALTMDSVYSNDECPFPECITTYSTLFSTCQIVCNNVSRFPSRGTSQVTLIDILYIEGSLDTIPDEALQNLTIRKFTLLSTNLTKITASMFKNAKINSEVYFRLPSLRYIEVGSLANFINVNSFDMSQSNTNADADILFNYNMTTEIATMINLEYLYLSNNKITHFPCYLFNRHRSLNRLTLSRNLLKEFTCENISNLSELDISNNQLENVSLKGLTSLRLFYINFNKLVNFTFVGLENLLYANMSDNLLKSAVLVNEKKLIGINLNNNRIERVILDGTDLSVLILSSNRMKEFPFVNNKKKLTNLLLHSNRIETTDQLNDYVSLSQLDLSDNFLEMIPDFEKLQYLKIFDIRNQSGRLNKVINYAFQREMLNINASSGDSDVYTINYRSNQISKYESKAFCVDKRINKITNGHIELLVDSIEKIHPCMFAQLKSAYTITIYIGSTPVDCDCQLVRWTRQMYNVRLFNYDCQRNCNQTATLVDIYDCANKPEYNCDIKPKERYTTWITGDPHLYSYRRQHEWCSFNQLEVVCLKYGPMSIYCTDAYVNNAASTRRATLLNKIRIEFDLSNVKYSIVADQISFGDAFTTNILNRTTTTLVDSNNEVCCCCCCCFFFNQYYSINSI
jgi:Leucine-rich repeat (LRR) protein